MHGMIRALCACLVLACWPGPDAAAQPLPAPANPPPSADLHYQINASYKGIPIRGDALIRWRAGPEGYSMRNQTRAMLLGRILEENSSGGIDRNGLAPLQFSQKRMRKNTAAVSIDRQARRIVFGEASPLPLRDGEQDRASAIWQLMTMARTSPESFKPGASWTFSVIGPRSVDPWTFQLIAQQTLKTAFGDIVTMHIRKAPPEKARDQQIDIWLAPALEWFPVRLHYAEQDGDTIEQTLIRISRK